MLYAQLCQRNPDPDHDPDFLRELQDLYEGGYTILRRAAAYLPRLHGEIDARYKERLRSSAYVSYLGQIVDSYGAYLFKSDLAIQPAADAEDPSTPGTLPDVDFYSGFAGNSDLKGTTFSNVLKPAFTTALVKRKAYVAVDFPSVDAESGSIADEDSVGAARAYCFEVPPEEVLDWCYDAVIRARAPIAANSDDEVEFEIGRFAWVILRRLISDRESPEATRGLSVEEFKIWRRDPDGNVVWELYRTAPYNTTTGEGQPKPEEDIPLCAGGTTSFREIPLLELRVPHGLWVGTKVGPLNKEHYQRRSELLASEKMSLYEIPVAFLGSESPEAGGAIPAERAQNPGRGDHPIKQARSRGFMVLGADDKFEFRGPSGAAYEIVDKQLDRLVDEMFRTAHQMASSVSSTANAVGRSGASKAEDRSSTTIILGALGAIVRDFARRIYGCISDARSEAVVWAANGLDQFDVFDRSEVLDEAVQVGAIAIPSRTWRVQYLTQVANRLAPNLPVETRQTIQREIDEATTAESVMAALQPPAPPQPPGSEEPDGDEEDDEPPESTPARQASTRDRRAR